MVGRDVEQLKVHFIGFHIAGAVDLKAHIGPNLVNATQALGGGMQASARSGATRQGHVDAPGGKGFFHFKAFDFGGAIFKSGFQIAFDLVGAFAKSGALFAGQFPHATQHQGDLSLFAQILAAPTA